MKLNTIVAGALASIIATSASADILVKDPYARTSGATAKSGAAFLVIENTGDEADQLIDATSDVAKLVELHTHKDDGNGVMRMMHVPEGFAVPAHGEHALARGGDHVMFMGLTRALAQGDIVTVTLTFEKAGEITVDIPVDLERMPGVQGAMKMGN